MKYLLLVPLLKLATAFGMSPMDILKAMQRQAENNKGQFISHSFSINTYNKHIVLFSPIQRPTAE